MLPSAGSIIDVTDNQVHTYIRIIVETTQNSFNHVHSLMANLKQAWKGGNLF